METSNPQANKERFTMKNFTKTNLAKAKQRTDRLAEKNASQLGAQSALQRLKAGGTPVSQAILDARQAGSTLTGMAPRQVKNAAIASLVALYNNRASELRPPQSNWTFEERWEVGWQKIRFTDQPMTAVEMIASLGKLFRYRANLLTIGYNRDYAYIPAPSSPRPEFWIYVCLYALPEDFPTIRELASKVYIPPSLSNMITKIRTNLLKEVRPPLQSTIDYLYSSIKYNFPEESISALALEYTGDLAKQWTWAVEKLLDWLLIHPNGTPVSTPSFPYNCTLKSNGNKWGRVEAGNEDLLVDIQLNMKRLLKAIAIRIATKLKRNPNSSIDELHDCGLELYQFLLSQTPRSDAQLKTEDLWPHIVWEQAAGNIKPVDAKQVNEGKPDRAIYMSPVVLRFLGMRCSQELTDAFTHPSKMTRFSYASGGAEKLLSNLSDQLYPDSLDDGLEYHMSPKPGSDCQNVHLTNAAVSDPDISSMDMQIEKTFSKINKDKIVEGYRLTTKNHLHILAGATFSFLQGTSEKPLILTNLGIFWNPDHLNPSGGPFTYALNELKSCGMRPDFEKFCSDPCFFGYKPHFGHVAHGDDQRIMYGFDPIKPNMATNLADYPDWKLPVNDHRSLVSSRWASHLAKVEKHHHVKFKKETAGISSFLSGSAYLGCAIFFAPEELYGTPAFVPARMASQSLFTAIWPKHPGTKAVNPHALYACRMYSAWYESAVVYKLNQKVLPNAYASAHRLIAKEHFTANFFTENIINPFDSDVSIAPPSLPAELPTQREIFTWLTGYESTQEIEVLSEEEGGDLLGFDSMEDDSPPSKRERKIKNKERDALKVKTPEPPAEELPIEELSGFDDEPQLVSLREIAEDIKYQDDLENILQSKALNEELKQLKNANATEEFNIMMQEKYVENDLIVEARRIQNKAAEEAMNAMKKIKDSELKEQKKKTVPYLPPSANFSKPTKTQPISPASEDKAKYEPSWKETDYLFKFAKLQSTDKYKFNSGRLLLNPPKIAKNASETQREKAIKSYNKKQNRLDAAVTNIRKFNSDFFYTYVDVTSPEMHEFLQDSER